MQAMLNPLGFEAPSMAKHSGYCSQIRSSAEFGDGLNWLHSCLQMRQKRARARNKVTCIHCMMQLISTQIKITATYPKVERPGGPAT
eukprot:6193135-Pleurochrysis_carterae.AAC.1